MAAPTPKVKSAFERFLGADHVDAEERAPSITNAEPYIEREPTVSEFLQEFTPSFRAFGAYFYSLFPFLSWIGKYNVIWLIGDLVAGKSFTPLRCIIELSLNSPLLTGITVGAVVVPQSMAYAQLAQLPVEYGLYTSFMGVLIYWFFATSKDITIGVRLHAPPPPHSLAQSS